MAAHAHGGLLFYVDVFKGQLVSSGNSQPSTGPWSLKNSCFMQRKKESDGKALYDSAAVYTKMLDRDWKRLCARDSFLHHFNVKRMTVSSPCR